MNEQLSTEVGRMTVRDVLQKAGMQGSDADTALSALAVQCGVDDSDKQILAVMQNHWFHPDLTRHQISAMLISKYGADAGRAAVILYTVINKSKSRNGIEDVY